MTKPQFEIHPTQDKKNLLSDVSDHKTAADQPDAHVNLGLFQRIIVAAYRALSARKTRRALQDLEPDRLRDISLDRSDLDRTAEDVADQASQAFARRLKKRQRSADQGTGSINSQIEYLTFFGKMLR